MIMIIIKILMKQVNLTIIKIDKISKKIFKMIMIAQKIQITLKKSNKLVKNKHCRITQKKKMNKICSKTQGK